jgi:hypothetical protein
LIVTLTGAQIALVKQTVAVLPAEKREVFLSRVASYLDLMHGGRRVDDRDLIVAIRASRVGLVREPAA